MCGKNGCCDKNDCTIVMKCGSGSECELQIQECHEEKDGSCTIVARCTAHTGESKTDCCCSKQ